MFGIIKEWLRRSPDSCDKVGMADHDCTWNFPVKNEHPLGLKNIEIVMHFVINSMQDNPCKIHIKPLHIDVKVAQCFCLPLSLGFLQVIGLCGLFQKIVRFSTFGTRRFRAG